MESKVLKTTKEITSKIDSGVAKKSSILTLIKSRQPSTLSRTSSRQSSVNLLDRRASSTSANKPRPATSFISTRVSQSSNPNIAVDDKLQLSVHQLGKLPAYLRNRRPASAIGKLERSESSTSRKLDKPKEEPFRFSPVYAVAKDLLEGLGKVSAKPYKEPDANLDDSGIQLCGPPCEGQGSGDAALQEAVLLTRDLDLKELVGKTRQLSDACDRKQERIVQLEAEVAAQGRAVQERDEDIQKMKSAMNKIKSLSNNRDTVAREGLSELEQRLDGLQKELTLKCNDLNRFKDKNSKLKQKLAEAKATVEERDNRIFELLEKDAARVEEIKAIKELSEELKQQLFTLKDDLSAKDSLIADFRSQDPVKIAQTELEAYRVEVASLQQEVELLRFENRTLISVKKQDDVILQIRTKLLENIERNRDAFRAQCERMCNSCIEGDRENGCSGQIVSRSLDVLFEALAERQWQHYEGDQIFSEADDEWNGNGLSDQLQNMTKVLAKENQEMLDSVRFKCGEEFLNQKREITVENSKSDDVDQINPEETREQHQGSNKHDNSEEQITSRTIYDNQISCDEPQNIR